MSHSELVIRWFREVWTEERTETVDALMAPDCRAYGLGPEPMVGIEAFKAWRAGLLAQFRVAIKVLQYLEDGDRVAVQCEATLTHRASGKQGVFTGACFSHIKDGLLSSSTNEWNFVDLLEQLGVAPQGGLAQVLGAPQEQLPRWA